LEAHQIELPQMIKKETFRRILPLRQRQLVVATLEKVLGARWKPIAFRYIDQTSLTALSRRRVFEPELKLVPFFISKPGAVFDIGANVGQYTYVLEKTVGARHTYSIEPVPQLCSKLMRLFPEVKVLNLALSETEGTQSLKIPVIAGSPLWSRSTLERFSEPGEESSIFEHVHLRTLDALCDENNVRDVAFIKVDVEGHEQKVLNGATKVIARFHPVLLVEIEQRHYAQPIADLFSWIQKQGYSGLFYDVRRMSLRPIAEFSIDSDQRVETLGTADYVNNFFFVREDAAHNITDAVHRAIRQSAIH
jgi:FkbM family methyltransferase